MEIRIQVPLNLQEVPFSQLDLILSSLNIGTEVYVEMYLIMCFLIQ